MHFTLGILFIAALSLAGKSDAPIVMSPYRVSPTDIVLRIDYLLPTDVVTAIQVTEVARDSAAEKIGIRVGDRIFSINGVPATGTLRRRIVGADGKLVPDATVIFVGKRGVFGRQWSVTVQFGSAEPLTPQPKGPSGR